VWKSKPEPFIVRDPSFSPPEHFYAD